MGDDNTESDDDLKSAELPTQPHISMSLLDSIDAAESIDGLLLNLLRNQIPLNVIKSFIKKQFANQSEDTTRKIFYEEMDIKQLVPTDITQHILSFAADEQ